MGNETDIQIGIVNDVPKTGTALNIGPLLRYEIWILARILVPRRPPHPPAHPLIARVSAEFAVLDRQIGGGTRADPPTRAVDIAVPNLNVVAIDPHRNIRSEVKF